MLDGHDEVNGRPDRIGRAASVHMTAFRWTVTTRCRWSRYLSADTGS